MALLIRVLELLEKEICHGCVCTKWSPSHVFISCLHPLIHFLHRLFACYCPLTRFSFIRFPSPYLVWAIFSSTSLTCFLSTSVYHPQHITHNMLFSPELNAFGTLHVLHRRISSNSTFRASHSFFPGPRRPCEHQHQPTHQFSGLGRPSPAA